MMPNITRGTRTRGLLGYLFGKGKSDEHKSPHLVAAYDDITVLEPAKKADGFAESQALTDLAARLDMALEIQEAAGITKSPKHVWQCSLSLAKDEGEIGDEKWGRIARRFIEEMGLSDCRWVAVHHGLSKNKNDHIHLAVVLAGSDGSKPRLHNDAAKSQQVVDALEDEFGLVKRTPGRSGDRTARKATTRQEAGRSEREQRPLTRAALRQAVRAATAGATSEAEWLANLAAAGVQLKPRVDDDGTVIGYSAALPKGHPAGGLIWFAGSTLDGELSLPRLRDRWPGQAPLTEAEWDEARSGGEQRALNAAERAALWGAAAQKLGEHAQTLHDLDPEDEQWPGAAQACADVLVQTAVIADADGADGELSQAADWVVRAAAPSRIRRQAAARDRVLARAIGQVGAQLRRAGAAQRRGEEPLVAAVVTAAVQLAVVVALWRQAQGDRAGFNVAATAVKRLGALTTPQPGQGNRPAVPSRASTRTPTPAAPTPRRRRMGPVQGPESGPRDQAQDR